ncbi:MAG: 50S ribosomal protein L19 [Pedosphaera sp.]|nr:50S ribosomal protein L19 [Pedosphaera sp.]MSU42962.1 50S ribosomal protein L19 [Pedosphaera sp.]
MNQALLDKIEATYSRKTPLKFNVGDTVKVHTRVKEGEKERTQVFNGIVIGRRGHGVNANFTVRRVSYGQGVERVFPCNSPFVEKVEVERHGKVKRAKLNYLRHRLGKEAVTVREKKAKPVAKPAAKSA